MPTPAFTPARVPWVIDAGVGLTGRPGQRARHHTAVRSAARGALAAALASALAVVMAGLVGCSNLPNTAASTAPLPAAALAAASGRFNAGGPSRPDALGLDEPAPDPLDAATWRGFQDPLLDELMARARTANLDVRIATERVRQARAGLTAVASRRLPTVSVTGSASDQRSGLPDEVKRGQPDTRAWRAALEVGWEIDVFGAARASAAAAEQDALAADAGVQAAQWLATTEVARQHLVWVGARQRLAQLQALLEAQRRTEALTRSRQAQGLASAFDLSRASGEVQALAAQLPALQALVQVTEHQIDLLLGEAPGGAHWAARRAVAPHVPAAPALSPGQPLALLQRRPDLRVAERQWRAEAARLRESEADQWPRLMLAAVLGRQDLRLNALDLSPLAFRNVAMAFTAPLFNAGRLRAAVERQSARERAATLQYERAVLGALQDVESSLAAAQQDRERAQWLAAAVQSRRTGLKHAESLHREGQIDLLSLLDAQRGLIAAELALTDAQTQRALGAVQLVKALGGGWYADPSPASADGTPSAPATTLAARQGTP